MNAVETIHHAAPRWIAAHERGLLIGLLAAAIVLRVCLVAFSPTSFGYVWDFYYEGVRYLYSHGRLPLAADCSECWHPPLFYVLGWPLYAMGYRLGGGEHAAVRWLGLLSMVCGAATTYYGYRLLRLFRARGGRLIVGVALLLIFPCLFISSYGAEADILVTSILSALLFYLTRDAAFGPPVPLLATVRLGVLAGAAAATKYSGLVGIASVVAMLGVHAISGRRRSTAIVDAALVVVICAVIGGWKYVDNMRWYRTPFFANGSAARGFEVGARQTFLPRYEFDTFRVGDLLRAVGPHADTGKLTDLPVYRSVFTTLHGLAWSDLNFFSEPTRHGDPTRPYPRKRQVWLMTASVLLLGLIPDGLALLGVAATFTRRSFRPAVIFSTITLTAYMLWLITQAEWGLKTKYILFLLPPGALFAIAGFDWIRRRSPALVVVSLAALLAALVVLTHVYLLIFAVG